MKSKRKFLIPALAVVLTAALAVGVFFFYKAFKKRINPEDQMIHNTQERIEYAQSCYKEFSKNPNKTYTVLVSLDSVTTEEFTQLFTGCGGFTQVYDCITEGVDDPMYGGYLDCEGKRRRSLPPSVMRTPTTASVPSWTVMINRLRKSGSLICMMRLSSLLLRSPLLTHSARI